MVESCQYSYFGDFSSPICCDDSSDLIFLEAAIELLGFVEPVEKTLAPSVIISAKEKIPLEIDPENVIINTSGEFEPKLHGSAQPVDEALARSVIIISEEKSPFNIEKETTQATNANQVKENRKRKKGKSKNGDEDPWLPAGWKMIEKYRKKGKLAGYVYKTYKAPGVRKSFGSKKQALEHIKNQKLDGVDSFRGDKSLEDNVREAQTAKGTPAMSIKDQVSTTLSETSATGGDARLNANT
ncbi:uncharacterized protein LOC132628577 [Lycium barbarum]|uniref:uncharacterized protein LOC132628577 n=1 Tax=Lycium barbarum TaxID=112863 RepID=UPI00293E50F0|nr:uncharacterized protein LOC132628577 [Lycium barbarum]